MSDATRRRGSLRLRIASAFAVLGLATSAATAFLTYQLARSYLTRQRERIVLRQVMLDASTLRDAIVGQRVAPADALALLAGSVSIPVLRVDGRWFSPAVDLRPSDVPDDVVALVEAGTPARRAIVRGGIPRLVVGVPLPATGAELYELVPLGELDRTLGTIGAVLAAAAVVTGALTALVGLWASRRVLLPLRRVSAAAERVRGGDLAARLDVRGDHELESLAGSFNAMAEALEQRIEREQRFTADVSHELRTPLQALTSAVALARREELTPRSQLAVDLLSGEVDRLRRLVLDLLEISRLDAGRAEFRPDDDDLLGTVRAATALHDPAVPVEALDALPPVAHDRRHLERVLANLLENARRYAGGATAVTIAPRGDVVEIAVEDRGPGVAAAEQQAIFERFHRGAAALGDGSRRGTGLGLALCEQHVRLHGGTVRVEDRDGGGARFVVSLPVDRA